MQLETKTTIDGNVVTEVGKINEYITIYRTEANDEVDFYFVNSQGCVLSVMRVEAHSAQGYAFIDDANILVPAGALI